MDQIEIQIMTWHMSPYWLDTWHNIDVTCGMNNFQKKNLNFKKIIKKKFKKIQKKLKKKKWEADTWHIITPLTPYEWNEPNCYTFSKI